MTTQRQRKTIVYGGAFNPPTLAHTAILRACIEYAQTQNAADVWVMPSGTRHDKTINISRQTRLKYIYAMIADVRHEGVSLRVDTSEVDKPYPTQTYDTVRELHDRHPNRNFLFVFGADSTQTMGSWRGGEELLAQLPMLVVDRPGYIINPAAQHAVKLPVVTPGISSTEVRRRRSAGESIVGLVSPTVGLLL